MRQLIRWAKFNLVGAIGMGVQLATLAVLHHVLHGHLLWALGVAIEITLLHNFLWHMRYTWADRRDSTSRFQQLVRFHVSNGAVSMLGNLVLTPLLVRQAQLPLLAANGVAILCCSVVNFWLGNIWSFGVASSKAAAHAGSVRRSMSKTVAVFPVVLILLIFNLVAKAQTPTAPDSPASSAPVPLPPAPSPSSTYHSSRSDTYLFNVGAFCGVGASTSVVDTKPAVGCGAGLTFIPLLFLEAGVMGPQANRSNISGYLSVDQSIPLASRKRTYLPLAVVGYSRLFETGHSFDYGLALALPRFTKKRDDTKSLRIELRDYWTFAGPTQHNVMLRIGWMSEVSD